MKHFYKSKDTMNRTKQQPTKCEKMFTNTISKRVLISKIYRELNKVGINKPRILVLKMGYVSKQRIFNRSSSNFQKTFK